MRGCRRLRGVCTVLLISALLLGFPLTSAHPQPLPELIEKFRPGVGIVRIRGSGGSGSATAFAVHPDGYLLTALHVVYRAAEIQVTLGAQTDAAEVVGIDQTNDAALLRVPRTGLVSLPLATAAPRTGEEIIVMGFPLAEVTGTPDVVVTRGIVSTLHPALPQTLQGALPIMGPLVQVDAAMNPGVSGGPVLNARGEVMGMAVGGLRAAANVNFAVPAATLQGLVTKVLPEGGGATRPPALPLPLTRTQAYDLNYQSRSGLTVMPKERVLEAACLQAPPAQAIAWVRLEGRLNLGVSPGQAARMGIVVWLSSPGGAPSNDRQASFAHVYIVGRDNRIGVRTTEGWSRGAARVCLNYEVNSGDLIAGHLFEARYTLDLLTWTAE